MVRWGGGNASLAEGLAPTCGFQLWLVLSPADGASPHLFPGLLHSPRPSARRCPCFCLHSDRGQTGLEAPPYPCQLCHLQQVTISAGLPRLQRNRTERSPGWKSRRDTVQNPCSRECGFSSRSSPTQATGGALRSPNHQVQWLFSPRRCVLPWCLVVLPTYAWRLVAMVSMMLPPGSRLSCYPFGSQSPLLASPRCPGALGPCPWPPSFPGPPCSDPGRISPTLVTLAPRPHVCCRPSR